MNAATTIVIRSSAVLIAGLAWVGGCSQQPAVSAEQLTSAMAREQLDDYSLAELTRAMKDNAAAFLAALPGTQRDFSDDERKDWDFWPSRYPGARMDQIVPEQRAVADRLLRLGLSAEGYEKLKLIQALEAYNPWRSPYYSLMVFGEPADEKPWGWRFQGHHLSLNFTLVEGKRAANTPLFLGTQPLSRSNIAGGKAPLGDEENFARKLYLSLDRAQKQQADIKRPPYTYLPQRTPKADPQEPFGVQAKSFSDAQRENLTALIEAYVDNVAPAFAAERRREIEQAGLDAIGFAWAGSDRKGRDHYYRIQGPKFIIEYDSRDGGSHIHSVWRSFDGDFGEDLLRKHYAKAGPEHGHVGSWDLRAESLDIEHGD